MPLSEDEAIAAARQALGKALARLLDEPSNFSFDQLKAIFTPESFDVDYTTKKGSYWLIVLDWVGENLYLERIIAKMFKNTKFDVRVSSLVDVEIPDIEDYLNKTDHDREETEETDLSDLPYDS